MLQLYFFTSGHSDTQWVTLTFGLVFPWAIRLFPS